MTCDSIDTCRSIVPGLKLNWTVNHCNRISTGDGFGGGVDPCEGDGTTTCAT